MTENLTKAVGICVSNISLPGKNSYDLLVMLALALAGVSLFPYKDLDFVHQALPYCAYLICLTKSPVFFLDVNKVLKQHQLLSFQLLGDLLGVRRTKKVKRIREIELIRFHTCSLLGWRGVAQFQST